MPRAITDVPATFSPLLFCVGLYDVRAEAASQGWQLSYSDDPSGSLWYKTGWMTLLSTIHINFTCLSTRNCLFYTPAPNLSVIQYMYIYLYIYRYIYRDIYIYINMSGFHSFLHREHPGHDNWNEREWISPAVHQNALPPLSHSVQEAHLLQCDIHNRALFVVRVCDKSMLKLSVANTGRGSGKGMWRQHTLTLTALDDWLTASNLHSEGGWGWIYIRRESGSGLKYSIIDHSFTVTLPKEFP